MRRCPLVLVGLALGLAPPIDPGAPVHGSQDPWFEEVAERSGIDFQHVRASETRFWFPEIMSGGAAWLDYDGDGDLDLYLVQGGALDRDRDRRYPNRLYRNDGAGRFVEVTDAAGVGDDGYGMGSAVGDYDGDGDVDLYITNVGPDVLYRNEGDGRFSDRTAEAGLGHPGWGASAAFTDVDGDRDLDLFVVSYINWEPANEIDCFSGGRERSYCAPNQYHAPAADVLYRNEGDGTFSDVSRASGIWKAFGNGLGVAAADFDLDGRVDLYVANDAMPNQLWLNRGEGRLIDEALLAGAAVSGAGVSQAGMGVAPVDLDDDGDLDLFLTHLRSESNTAYLNEGGLFTDVTAELGLAAPSIAFTGFGTGFADFDHDGVLDLYVVNGRVGRGEAPLVTGDPYAEPNLLFRGLGGGRFQEVEPRGGTAGPLVENSRAAAFGDYDGDGDIDVVVVNNGGPARLLRNRRGSPRGWIRLRVLDAGGGPAVGARARVETAAGAQWRLLHPAYSYCASNDPGAHFGLGGAASAEVLVIWPRGERALWSELPAGRVVTVYGPGGSTQRPDRDLRHPGC